MEVLTVLDQAAELAVAGWPTPQVTAAGWPTPQEDNANNAYGHKGTVFSDLPTTAQTAGWHLTGWPTPSAGGSTGEISEDLERHGNPGTDTYNPAGNTDSSRKTVALLTGWKHAPTH